MRKLFVSALLCLLMFCSKAQTPKRINSGEIIASGIKLYDAGHYKEAIALYNTIPRNDSNYALSLYELCLSYRADSNFTKAVQTCEKALRLDDKEYEMQVLTTYGSTLDDQGNQERAIRVYDSALLKYPNAPILHLNKGIALFRAEKITEAEVIFKDLVVKDPYYASAHFRLALCALNKGQVVPAMFSLFTYLIINPSGNYYSNVVYILNNISKGNDDILKYVDNRTTSDDAFSAAEQIVLSKIALDKSYKVKTSFDDPIIRQLQVAMEKVTYDAGEKNFWMQYYVPLFQAMYKEAYFEPLVYHAFSNTNLEPIQRYVKKNGKEIKTAISFFVEYLNPIRSTRELQATRRKEAPVLYHFEEGEFVGAGMLDVKGTLTGPWKFYHTNGNLKSTGTYNAGGEKEGLWKYYSKTGQLTGIDNWTAGKQNGEDLIYNSQNVLTAKAQYQNGLLHGNKEVYYGIGHLYSKAAYTEGKQNGPYMEYYSNGRRKIEASFKTDALDGTYKTYYKNGQLETEVSYSNGKAEGVYKTYHDNGALRKTGTYKNGNAQGEEKEFHPNGQLKKVRHFADDLLEGDALEYNNAGVLVEKITYKSGKAQGLAEYYDSDGKQFSTFLFDKNILKTARYFDKNGTEISKSDRQNKTIDLTVYNPDGLKLSTTTYNDAADKINSDTYFYSSGKTRETNQYKEGKLDGVSTGYYANGAKEYEIGYAADEKDGLSTYYYQNGNIKSQGWYDGGVLNDTWTNYNEKGMVINRTAYLNDDITGYRETYFANGKLEEEEVYKNGWLLAIYQYDSLGNRIHTTDFKNGNGIYKGIHFNGKTSYEGQYMQGEFEGAYKAYFFDGSPSFVKNFEHGLLEGAYTDYYFGGNVATTGTYKSDKRTGLWKSYTADGALYKEETYVNGELNGKRIYYYSNGKIEREFEYKDDLRNGTMKRYATDGQLSAVFYYKDDVVTGYTYLDKGGRLLPVKPLPCGNGTVQTFYSNGNKSSEMTYVAGLLVGANKLYHANGKLYYETTEDYSNSNGKLTEYYDNGTLKKEYLYAMDKEDGPYKEYYENGTVKEEGTYYNGLPHGIATYYNVAGKRIESRTYYFGTLLNASK